MKKSRILSLVLIALFVFSLSVAAYAEETNYLSTTLEASASSVETGKTFTVDVVINENTGFRYALLEVVFSSDALTVTDVKVATGAFATVVDSTNISIGESLVKIPLGNMMDAMGMTNSIYDGVGTVATITFQVKDTFEGTAQISMATKENYVRDLENLTSTFVLDNGYTVVGCYNAETHEHSPEVLPAKAPTCTETGLTEGAWCPVCGEIITAQTTIDALGHTEEVIEAKAPSCSEAGWTEGRFCSVCDEVFVESVEIPATGEHNYVTEIERVDPTCTEAGYVIRACGCGETQRENIAALGHTEIVLEGYASTCTAKGLTDGKYCTVCNTITVAQEELDMAPHDEEVLPGVAATCTEAGKTPGKVCAVCNAVLVAPTTIPASGHTEIQVSAVAPTCSSTGLTAGVKCATCGITISGREVVGKLEHTEEIIPAVNSTCNTVGKSEGKKCSVCGEILVPQTEIPTIEHTRVTIEAIAPTCTTVGWTEGSQCSACGEVLVVPTEVAKSEHTPVTIPGVDATCTETGSTEGQQCSACEEILTNPTVLAALGHKYDNDCDTTCNTCGEVRTVSDHSFGQWVTTKEATKDAAGERVRTCSVCGAQESQEIPVVTGGFGTGLIVGIAFVVMIACVVVIVVVVRKK